MDAKGNEVSGDIIRTGVNSARLVRNLRGQLLGPII